MIDIVKILEILPHRYPFVLVDRVIDCEALLDDPWIHALKNVTINEPFFEGHFPSRPVMPGVMILEGLAQTAGLLLCEMSSLGSEEQKTIFYYAGIDKARFRIPVVPGDQIQYQVTHLKTKRGLSKFDTKAFVDTKKVAEAEIMLSK